MNKKLNSIIFILLATIVNLVIMTALSLVPLFLFWHFFAKSMDQAVAVIISLLLMTAAIGGTFVIYLKFVAAFEARFDLDTYFEPEFLRLFRKKQR